MADPLPIGTTIPQYGTIEAVVFAGGERYYLCASWRGVSFMPASVIEPMVASLPERPEGSES